MICACVCSSRLLRQTTTVSELDRIISDICDDDPSINKVGTRLTWLSFDLRVHTSLLPRLPHPPSFCLPKLQYVVAGEALVLQARPNVVSYPVIWEEEKWICLPSGLGTRLDPTNPAQITFSLLRV